jgi:hypothetical protein
MLLEGQVALGPAAGFAAFDDLLAVTVGTSDRDERHGSLLAAGRYQEETQCDINRSPSPLLEHYPQVIKTTRRRRLVEVKRRVIFGTQAAVEQVLAACGWQINTAFIERLNLDIRQHVAAVGRRVNTVCKAEDGVRQQLVLFQTYHNFCLPHASLRQPLAQPEPTNGSGSAKQWRPCTPAMAAALTDHVWSLKEVWLYRVPPWPQSQAL